MLHTTFKQPSCVMIAFGTVALATFARAVIDLWLHEQIPYTTFYPAIMITALCCGMRWGLVSMGLSALAASFWLTPLGRPLIAEVTDFAGMALFLLVSSFIVWLAARVREHRHFLEQAAEERQQLLILEQQARVEAECANRAKDDFLAAATHELRTPLSSIVGWVELIKREALAADEVQVAIESIARSAKVQTQLVSDILDLSRIQKGKLRLEVHPICLSELTQSAIQTIVPAAAAKGIELKVDVPSSAGPVLGDEERLHQVCWNLLSNAIKFTPSGGKICVRVHEADETAELIVSDTGEGIDPRFLEKVFRRFEQGEVRAQQRGLGLGLAITKEIVELHGGTISVKSAGRGHGAEFSVSLPKLSLPAIADIDQDATAVRNESPSPAELAGKLILIIDDDSEARSIIEMVLNKYGASTMAVASAGEALHLARLKRPDVVVSDIGMPGVDGFEFIRQLRLSKSQASNAPAIALSAYTSEHDRRRALQSGFQLHLAKPVNARELVQSIAKIVNFAIDSRN
jgi:signal transduction histidine kinase/ActR/RegA family two-component response regulator